MDERVFGDRPMPVSRLSYVEHPGVTALRDTVLLYRLERPDRAPLPVDVLRRRVTQAWQVWHRSRTRRADVAAILPALLVDCQDAASGHDGPERRPAHAVLAQAYQLTQHVLVNAAEPALMWLVVDRAMAAAQVADDPVALAGAAWTVGMMLRSDGRPDDALAIVGAAADLLVEALPDGDPEVLGMWGALQLHAALTAGRAGRDGDAWAHWDRAETAIRRLPAGHAHPWTVFGRANVDLTAVSLTVDLWKSRDGLRRAAALDPRDVPSRERRGRLFVEMARGHHAVDERIASTRLLLAACDEGVDAVRFSPAARAIVEDLQERPPYAIRDDVTALAARVGLDPA